MKRFQLVQLWITNNCRIVCKLSWYGKCAVIRLTGSWPLLLCVKLSAMVKETGEGEIAGRSTYFQSYTTYWTPPGPKPVSGISFRVARSPTTRPEP
jgi:hypothetical protein